MKMTSEQIDQLHQRTIKSEEIKNRTFYLDELTTGEFAVSIDETNLKVCETFPEALELYNEKIKSF